MGIQNFHTWLKAKYPGSYIQIKNNNIYEYIYIDVNFMLHHAIYNCKTEDDFIKKLYSQLDIIFANFIATKQIYFSLDGPSSFAKILLQRERRSDISKNITLDTISSLYITPGVEPMKRIEKYLSIYINKLKVHYRFINPEIIMASSNEPDEGEIKICNKVIKNGIINLNHRHLIIGNDSDLIALSMGMKPIYNINILVKGKSENSLISLSKLLLMHCTNINRPDTIEKLATNTLRDDFVIISIMMGNDYLPKLGYINHDKLWKLYFDLIKSLHDNETLMNANGNFNIDIMKKFFYMLYNNLSKGYKKISINTYNDKRAQMYFEGLLWCLNMYQTGKCPQYDYSYIDSSPHPYELLFHIHANNEIIKLQYSQFPPISAEIYSLIIMPKKAICLIPKKYHKLMNNELKYLYEIEECDICATYKKDNKILRIKIKEYELANIDSDNVLKDKYNKNYSEYLNHRKTHASKFNPNDINKIIELASKI